MSGSKLTRRQRLMGAIGAAAVVASSSMALAGKPPPAPTAPQPAPLNADPAVQWFADWHENSAASAPPDFFATPSNAAPGYTIPVIQAQMNGSAAAGRPLGIKVETPLSGSDATALFNTQYTPGNRAISYVFSDMEQGTTAQVLANVTTLVSQVRGSTWSKNAYVGQWDMTPLNPSDEQMGRVPPQGQLGSAHRRWGKPEYDSSGVNMANSALYPGASDYRNTATGDWMNSNIRTGLFLAPIGRMTQVQNILDSSYNGTILAPGVANHKQIPWVSRFNNFGNNSLDNGDLPGAQFVFIPGTPLPGSTASTTGQMLGRGDFSAQIRHYRNRGAYSVNLFEPGVVGYTKAEMQQDVRDGWKGDARLNAIFAQGDNKPATMTLNPQVDNLMSGDRAERTGTIWSGQYSLNAPNPNSTGGKGDLSILVSNLDSVNHLVKFGTVDAFDVFTDKSAQGWTYTSMDPLSLSRNALIEAGMHRMLTMDLVQTRVYNSKNDMLAGNNKYKTQTVWLLSQNYSVFGTNNDRNEMGIPEPTTFGSLAAAGAIAVVCRRQRRKA